MFADMNTNAIIVKIRNKRIFVFRIVIKIDSRPNERNQRKSTYRLKIFGRSMIRPTRHAINSGDMISLSISLLNLI